MIGAYSQGQGTRGLTLSRCRLSHNRAGLGGGAVFVGAATISDATTDDSIEIEDSWMSENRAMDGELHF